MERTAEEQKFINFYDDIAEGKIPCNRGMYYFDCNPSERQDQEGSAAIQLVTPTQQQVEQAKMQLKRKVVSRVPAPKRRRVASKARVAKQKSRKTKKVKKVKARKKRVQKGACCTKKKKSGARRVKLGIKRRLGL